MSDAQQFSKLYYVRRYKKLVTKTWQDFYLAHYERVKEDVAKVDATERDKVVRDSIREDLRAGVLDSVPTKVLGAEEDVEDEDITENDEDQEERGGRGDRNEDEDKGSPGESPSIKVPTTPVWFRNAIMRMLWTKASRSQRNAVEEHKMKEDGEEMDDSDNEVEVGDGDKRVKRLNRLLRFVFMDTSSILELMSLTFSSRRSAMEYTVIRLLDQIFKETGFVGTVSLAGPDPHKGGKMMTVSCVWYSLFISSPCNSPHLGSIKRSLIVQTLRKCILDTNKPFPTPCVHIPLGFFVCIVILPLILLACSPHNFVVSSDRSEWAFPGTEHLYNQQQEGHDLGALYNSIPTPGKLATSSPLLVFPNAPHRQIIAPLVNSPNQAPYMEIASESCGADFSNPFAAAMWDTAFADAMPPEKDTQVEAAALDKAAQVITSTQVLTSATLDTSASPHVSASLYVSASPRVSASPASPCVTTSPRTSAPAPTTPAIEEDILTQPATKSKSQTSATVRRSKRHASPGANAAELDASSNARPARTVYATRASATVCGSNTTCE